MTQAENVVVTKWNFPLKATDKPFHIYLKLMSCFMKEPPREMEIRVLTAFYEAGGEVNESSRRQVCEALGMVNLNLNNYVVRLAKAGLLVPTTEKHVYLLHKNLQVHLPSGSDIKFEILLQRG